MRRFLLLLVPVFTFVAVVVAVAIGNSVYQPGWEAELQKYFLHRRSFDTVRAVIQASRPQNFSETLSLATYSSGPYSTNYYFEDKPWAGAITPYPATEVWCVLLKHTAKPTAKTPPKTTYTVIFINYHLTLWYGGWIVHEGETSPFSPNFINGVEALGCGALGLRSLPRPVASP